MALIAQALTSMKNVRLALGLYTIASVTATETLTTDSARLTFNFLYDDILQNYFGIFAEVTTATGSASTTVTTSTMTIDYDLGAITFSAAMTGNITCASYKYYSWDYTKDRQLERMINSVSTMVSSYCNRSFIADTYTEYYRGLGHQKLLIDKYPINKITSVKVNSALLTAGTDYITADSTYLANGFLVKENGWTWYGYETGLVPELTAPVDNIEVIYSAGYTLSTLPSCIEDAVLDLVSISYNTNELGSQGLKSMSQGGLSYSWQDNSGKSTILSTLDSYKRAVI